PDLMAGEIFRWPAGKVGGADDDGVAAERRESDPWERPARKAADGLAEAGPCRSGEQLAEGRQPPADDDDVRVEHPRQHADALAQPAPLLGNERDSGGVPSTCCGEGRLPDTLDALPTGG